MGLQSLGSTGQVEGIRVSVQQVLEGLQGGLAGLQGRKYALGIGVSLSRPCLTICAPYPSPRQEMEKVTAPACQEPGLALPEDPVQRPRRCTCLQGKSPGSTASLQSVFQVTGSCTTL